jgi:hypothetical protein
MKIRAAIAAMFVATAVACAPGSDSPTGVAAPESAQFGKVAGVKPPPPLGSEETSIQIYVPGDDFGEFSATHGPSANVSFPGFLGFAQGRYFANTQSTNGWIQFVTANGVTASNNAKLSYNEKNGKTTGQGTLTDPYGHVLDLSLVQIVPPSHFGTCDVFQCASIQFIYAGQYPGSINVYSGPAED